MTETDVTSSPRSAKPAWFDPEGPRLLGQRCAGCESVFFPPELDYCQNPACESQEFTVVPLSDRGTVWSWTKNHYKPPAPAVSPDPFVPYTVVAVELAAERIVVLGQLSAESDPVEVGDEVELRSEVLLKDGDGTQLVWRWARSGGRES